MTRHIPAFSVKSLKDSPKAPIIVLVSEKKALPQTIRDLGADIEKTLEAAMTTLEFSGKRAESLKVALSHKSVPYAVLIGVGDAKAGSGDEWRDLGGVVQSCAPKTADTPVAVIAEVGSKPLSEEEVLFLAEGLALRTYVFDDYKVKKKEEDRSPKAIDLHVSDPKDLDKKLAEKLAVIEGTNLARHLVNLPTNDLSPEQFASRCTEMRALGVDVTVYGEKELKEMGMRALLAVGQGSTRESKVVIMRWNGGKEGDAPHAFVGKGVVFDTGGISIKPSASMEDMKGDMGGAAAVTGLMHAVARTKLKLNVVGVIGLVENMPDGNAQRPGDIIKTLSGQTVEVINTDAEGRLVLADILWYTEETTKPKTMINLATLTGAIVVSLGNEFAGLFSNSDKLVDDLKKASKATGEGVWHQPLSKGFDKQIDSQFADMKNTGGRWGGSITAAQFLQRYVRDTKWAHLDIAGTAFGAPKTDTNTSWGTGFGVRLLHAFLTAKGS